MDKVLPTNVWSRLLLAITIQIRNDSEKIRNSFRTLHAEKCLQYDNRIFNFLSSVVPAIFDSFWLSVAGSTGGGTPVERASVWMSTSGELCTASGPCLPMAVLPLLHSSAAMTGKLLHYGYKLLLRLVKQMSRLEMDRYLMAFKAF